MKLHVKKTKNPFYFPKEHLLKITNSFLVSLVFSKLLSKKKWYVDFHPKKNVSTDASQTLV